MNISKHRKLKKLEDEQWREIPETDGRYFISNYGRIKSFVYDKIDGKLVKFTHSKGYKIAPLYLDKKDKRFYVHKLTAEVWIPKPDDKHIYVSHIDGNVKNNHVSNLQWHTKESLSEKNRIIARQKLLTSNNPVRSNNCKLKPTDIMLLKSMLQRGISQVHIAKLFAISEMQVYRIKSGKNWGHILPEKIV